MVVSFSDLDLGSAYFWPNRFNSLAFWWGSKSLILSNKPGIQRVQSLTCSNKFIVWSNTTRNCINVLQLFYILILFSTTKSCLTKYLNMLVFSGIYMKKVN